MLHFVALGDDLLWRWIAYNSALDCLLGGLIVEFLNFLVVVGIPMDEHTDANEEVVGLVRRYDPACDTIGHRLGDAALRRAEHLDGLLSVFDGYLVKQDRRGLAHEVWCDHGEQGGKTILVVGERVGKCRFRRAAPRSDHEIDVSNFVAIADERFADAELVYLCHTTEYPHG